MGRGETRGAEPAIEFRRRRPVHAADGALPFRDDGWQVPVHLLLREPGGMPPISAQMPLDTGERDEVGFKSHRGRRPAIKMPTALASRRLLPTLFLNFFFFEIERGLITY